MAAIKTVFFCGIGGSGMSALAQVLRHHGHAVRGSDRRRDHGQSTELFDRLCAQGIGLYPQDGSGVDDSVDELIVSAAVEEHVPDVRAALRRAIPVRKRAEVLAELFNRAKGVAVGGTSGKTTVAGMIGHILQQAGRNPTAILGGSLLNDSQTPTGNAICGDPGLQVIEADESDGTIVLYEPSISVLTNISLDHKPLEELREMFREFVQKARRGAVINMDCELSAKLDVEGIGFGVENCRAQVRAEDVRPMADGVAFEVGGTGFRLKVPGRHNVSNAVAAVAACWALGVSVRQSAAALATFAGIRRRLQVLGTAGGVTVIDDFAHNPDKIAATLSTLKEQPGRLLVMFPANRIRADTVPQGRVDRRIRGGIGESRRACHAGNFLRGRNRGTRYFVSGSDRSDFGAGCQGGVLQRASRNRAPVHRRSAARRPGGDYGRT